MPVPDKPTIKLFFTGLQAFFFDSEGYSCRVGMHNQAPSHKLCFQVKVFYEGSERVIDLSDVASGFDIRLNVVNPKTPGVEPYRNGSFERESPDNDPQDFRWVIGIRGKEFHGEVPIDHTVLRPSFYTNNGLFYTQDKVRARIIRKRDGIDKVAEIAEHIAANIDLQNGNSEAVLTFGMNGEQSLHLRKEPNTRYEITISNDCPPSLALDSDFKFYYKAFLVPDDDQFDLTGATIAAKSNKGKKAMAALGRPCAPVCGQGEFC